MAQANHPTDKVRALQRTLYVAAKQKRQRRFHALYDRIARPDVLARAWENVRRNRGAAGVDGETLAAVEAYGADTMLTELRDQLVAGRYRPRAVRRVYIPKPGRRGERRPLGIPGVRDRVVQAATKLVLEPIFETNFLPCSYGFRPKRNAVQALECVRKGVNAGGLWVVEVDFADFFGSLDRKFLLGLVARRVSDRRVLRLIRMWLRAGIVDGGVTTTTATGVPQGGVISPLLSNIYGHALDALWQKEAGHLGTLVRWADDLVILCRSETDAQQAFAWLGERAPSLRLRLHPDKCRVVSLHGGREGFDFLGFHHRLGWSRTYRTRLSHRWPSRRAMAAVRGKVKAITGPRYRLKEPIHALVSELNPVLRGWGNYFRWGNSSAKFSQVDSYVQERLALFSSKKHQKHGRRWGSAHGSVWYDRLGVYRLSGTIRYDVAARGVT